MMTLVERLRRYCLTPALAGFEDEMIKALKRDLSEHVDEIKVDVLGNVIATIRAKKRKCNEPNGVCTYRFTRHDCERNIY